MIYNVKAIEYPDSVHLRIYSHPIIHESKIISNGSKKVASSREPHERTEKQIKHSMDSSVGRTVNKIYSITRSNKWEYFITLTIDPKKLDSTDFSLILDKLSIWVNNLKRRYAPNLRYIFVPELHKDKTKWHFHGLFADVGSIPFTFSGKTCVGRYIYDYVRKPYAMKVYNLPLWKYGFSTATQVRDSSKSGAYITKYITKDVSMVLKNRHRFVASHNCDTPIEKVYNVDYGFLENIITQNINHVDYITNVHVPDAGQTISYMEFNR